MKDLVSITRFDLRSNPDNPIKPNVAVVDITRVSAFVNSYLDKDHSLLIQRVESDFPPFSPDVVDNEAEN